MKEEWLKTPRLRETAADVLQRYPEVQVRCARALLLWLYGCVFMPMWVTPTGERKTPPLTRARLTRVTKIRDSAVGVPAGDPHHYLRLTAALRDGLERRVGKRLGSEEGWLYVLLLALVGAEPERVGVCSRCRVVFTRARADRRFCSAECRKVRPLAPRRVPVWVRYGEAGSFETTVEGFRRPHVELACEDCARGFWTRDPSRRFCERCGGGAARTKRARRLAADTG